MLRVLIATLAGTVVYFIVGWLVFEKLLGTYMAGNTTAIQGFKKTGEETSMPMLLVSCAAYALLLSIVFEYWANVRTLNAGIALGAITGILVAIMTNSYWYSSTNFFNSLAPLVIDVAAAGLTVGIMGGAIGWLLGILTKWI